MFSLFKLFISFYYLIVVWSFIIISKVGFLIHYYLEISLGYSLVSLGIHYANIVHASEYVRYNYKRWMRDQRNFKIKKKERLK